MIKLNIGDAIKPLASFVSKNWQVLALLAVVILFFVSKNDFGALQKSMEVMTLSYQEQIASMEALHRRELKMREDSIAFYENQLAELNQKYDEAISDLRVNWSADIKKLERDFDEQPDALAKEVSEQFGLKYVE
jgi:hypothetical protein